jgi:ring-1,2-phenylacetyl-CoA epoxidase subunit PaaE
MNPRFHELKIADVRKETEDTVSVAFEVPSDLEEAYRYEPGQYLTLRQEIGGEDIRRSYSICSGINEDELRVAIKKVPQGKFSTFANESLKVGAVMKVMTPTGGFTTDFNEGTEKNYVFFAAGSGITPVISLIKSILHKSPKSDVTLVYGNKGLDSVIFREELENLKNEFMNKFSLIHVFSREKIGNNLQDGRLDEDRIVKINHAFLEGQDVDEVLVCGPEPIIYAVKDAFGKLGFPENNVRFELFTSPGESDKEKAKVQHRSQGPRIDANVKVILDGEETLLNLDSDGDSILDAAQKGGADVPFSCKGGVCCTCKAKILQGTAKMDVNYALEDDEVADGYILTCQAHPTSDELIVSFDD